MESLPNATLIEAYLTASAKKLDKRFIHLLRKEIENRDIDIEQIHNEEYGF